MAPEAIVDGLVITYNITEALSNGIANDVPVIFGTMHDEPDVGPVNVVINYTLSEFTDFINLR